MQNRGHQLLKIFFSRRFYIMAFVYHSTLAMLVKPRQEAYIQDMETRRRGMPPAAPDPLVV
jgi:hypothetical protein